MRRSGAKRMLYGGVAALVASAAALPAQQTIAFERDWWSQGGSSAILIEDRIPVRVENYEGFTWTNFGVVDRRFNPQQSDGYKSTAARTRSDIVGFNYFGGPASFGRSTAFDFASAWVAGGQREGLTLSLRGLDALGNELYATSYEVGLVPKEITPNWTGVRTVEFSTSGGRAFATPGVYTFAIDDIVIGSTVPEPATVGLMAFGLIGIAVTRRTRKP